MNPEPTDAREWIERYLRIVDKAGELVPLSLNEVQADYWSHRTERDVILKARQFGFSTLILAWLFHEAATTPNLRCVSIAHTGEAAEALFRKVHEFYRHLPEPIKARLCANPDKPRYANKRQLHFDRLGSWLEIGSAESDDFGRGGTIHRLHCSEVAFWPRPQAQVAGLLQAVPLSGRVVYESTANGMGNWHHQLYLSAKAREGRLTAHFYPWYWGTEYRLPAEGLVPTEEERGLQAAYGLDAEQLAFRRAQITELHGLWSQEYPANDVEAFLASGRPVFLREAILARITEVEALPVQRALGGQLEVYEEPRAGVDYLIAADPAEGILVDETQRTQAGADYCAAHVLRCDTGEQVAELQCREDPDRFARMLASLGQEYNEALLVVERNNHGHAVLLQLRNLEYPRIYKHEHYDQHLRVTQRKPGFPTDTKTRPLALGELKRRASIGLEWIRGKRTLEQMNTFVVAEDGKEQADVGCHDDLVMALAIGRCCLPDAQQSAAVRAYRAKQQDRWQDDARRRRAETRTGY